jgi:hypothetical protein
MTLTSLCDSDIPKNACHIRRLLLVTASRMTIGLPLWSLYSPWWVTRQLDYSQCMSSILPSIPGKPLVSFSARICWTSLWLGGHGTPPNKDQQWSLWTHWHTPRMCSQPLCTRHPYHPESPLMLPGGGVNRRSLEINPTSTSSNHETETLSRTLSGWVCPDGPDNVRQGVLGRNSNTPLFWLRDK